MKKLFILVLAAFVVAPAFAGSVSTVGNTDLEITGGLRIRWDYYNNVYDFEDDEDVSGFDDDFSYTPVRANVRLKAMVSRNVDIVTNIQGVDSFGGNGGGWYGLVWGPWAGIGPYDFAGAGQDTQSAHWGIYEAYLHARNVWDSKWSLKFGRQEMSLGDEFLVGNDDWYDGLVFDGMRWDFNNDHVDLVLFAMKLESVPVSGWDTVANEEDDNFYGVHIDWKYSDRHGLDSYLFYLNQNSWSYSPNDGGGDYTNWTVGVRWFSREQWNQFDWNVNFAYQDHDWNEAFLYDSGNGWAFEGTVGYNFNHDWEPRLAFGLTHFTGDDDALDMDKDGFWRMFGDTHGRWGLADMLYSSGVGFQTYDFYSVMGGGIIYSDTPGAWILQLNASFKPRDNMRWGANALYLTQVEDDFGSGLDYDSDAWELDAWYSYDYSEHLSMKTAVSYINMDAEFFGVDADFDNAWRAYVDLTGKW